MANLVMTIDSDSDSPPNVTEAEPPKETAAKKQKISKVIKQADNSIQNTDDAEIFLQPEQTEEQWFWTEKEQADGSKYNQQQFMTKEDGAKQTMWNFRGQIKIDNVDQRLKQQDHELNELDLTKDETEDGGYQAKTVDETMNGRVQRLLDERGIQIDQTLIQTKKSKDDGATHDSLLKNKEGSFHYDKEDLVQFHELMLSKPLVRACSDLDYEHPTVIQRRVIPAILEGHDILAHAVTGSGKTAAYELPILQKYLRYIQTLDTEMGQLRYLILQPTRELAAQSHAMLETLAKYVPNTFTSAALFGGSSLKDERRKITQECPDIVIATPGRLIDHLHNTKSFTLEYVEVLVLDEADRLLEMGFKDELMEVLKQCTSPKRQTLMLSATLNQDLKELAKLALKEPKQFSIDKQQREASAQAIKLTQYLVRLQFEGLSAPKKGSQSYDKLQKSKKVQKKKKLDPDHPNFDSEEEYGNEANSEASQKDSESEMSDEEQGEDEIEEQVVKQKRGVQLIGKKTPADQFLVKREATLISILSKSFKSRVIIFANEKAQCTRLMALLTIFGFKAAEIHSNKTQDERLKALESFQKGEVDYLIGTDVISRGLDIPNVRTVINFSFPTEPKRYLHRIGRTARAGQHGIAVNLCNEEERKELKKLTRKLNQNMNTFTVQNKYVSNYFDQIVSQLDEVVKTVQCEIDQTKEMKEAMRDLEKSKNMIKYKDEIMSRPKKEWFVGNKRRNEVSRDSKDDLKNIKRKFEDQLTNQERNKNKKEKKRGMKEKEKTQRAEKGESGFKSDFEAGKKAKYSKPAQSNDESAQKQNYYKKKKQFKKSK